MKVRSKRFPDDGHWTVWQESLGYYICDPRVQGGEYILSKDDYEPVLNEQWVDITRECRWDEGQYLFHSGNHIGWLSSEYSDNYRVRAVSLWEELPQPMRDILVAQNTTRPELVGQLMRSISFLIERKVAG